jgi:tetratricopeptide (TPR) repeat protein
MSIDKTGKPVLLYVCPNFIPHLAVNNHEPIIFRSDAWFDFHFEVHRVSIACSLAREIERVKPDIIVFDGLIECLEHLRVQIRDIHYSPQIPRVGWCRIDSLSPARRLSFQLMEDLGAEAFFILGDTGMAEALEDRKDKVFYVPQFVNQMVFRDYGLEKVTPVLLVGNFDSVSYPWRQESKKAILDSFPCLYFRHPGYIVGKQGGDICTIYGERYARILNSAYIAPTSGGFKNITVTKHIEIPASRTSLICEETEGVKLLGFESMKNCVFAREGEVTDAIALLLRDGELRRKITDEGFHFAHSQHTIAQRTQLVEWLNLRKQIQPDQKIIQPDLIKALQIESAPFRRETIHLRISDDWKLIRSADQCIEQGDLDSAIKFCKQVLAYCEYAAEPKLRIAIAWLLRGYPAAALHYITQVIVRFADRSFRAPDPSEAAYFIVALLASNQYDLATVFARRWSRIRALDLDCARWITAKIAKDSSLDFNLALYLKHSPKMRISIHQLAERSPSEQIKFYMKIMAASKARGTYNGPLDVAYPENSMPVVDRDYMSISVKEYRSPQKIGKELLSHFFDSSDQPRDRLC